MQSCILVISERAIEKGNTLSATNVEEQDGSGRAETLDNNIWQLYN